MLRVSLPYYRYRSLKFAVLIACCLLAASPAGMLFAEEVPTETGRIPPSQGASDAPITVVEYGDFQ